MTREEQGATLKAARHDNKCNKAMNNKATMMSNKPKTTMLKEKTRNNSKL
jgi:hypothetical protein